MTDWRPEQYLRVPQDFCDVCRWRKSLHNHAPGQWVCLTPPQPHVDDLLEPIIDAMMSGEILKAFGLIRRTFNQCEDVDANRLIYEISLLIVKVSKAHGRLRA